jgi:hypothetical protein
MFSAHDDHVFALIAMLCIHHRFCSRATHDEAHPSFYIVAAIAYF